MSIAGKTRRSAILRSRTSSMLPVPLNSSKITSSMREPVSIERRGDDRERAAARRCCAPRRRSASASRAPWRRRRRRGSSRTAATTALCARARRVIESSRMTTSLPCSTSRFAFSITMSATCTWRSAGSSNVELITSAFDVREHVGDFFRPLVDEQDDERDLGMILGDRVGDLLQEDRLAGARRRDDQPALALCRSAR